MFVQIVGHIVNFTLFVVNVDVDVIMVGCWIACWLAGRLACLLVAGLLVSLSRSFSCVVCVCVLACLLAFLCALLLLWLFCCGCSVVLLLRLFFLVEKLFVVGWLY